MNNDHIIKVFVGNECNNYLPEISYAFEEISLRIGLPIQLSNNPNNGNYHLVYGRPATGMDMPFVPFDAKCYEPAHSFKAFGSQPLWIHHSIHHTREIDLVGGVFRLLGLLDEQQVPESLRDGRGIFRADDLPDSRQQVLDQPLVENHASAIEKLIRTSSPRPEHTPYWKPGKSWAFLLTHDTDAVNLSAIPELIFNSAKTILRRDKIRFLMAKDGLRFLRRPVLENPLFGFPRWRQVTESLGIRSAFYLATCRSVKRTVNDCRSMVGGTGFNWDILKKMADDGWEFGLHPPIRAKDNFKEYVSGKRYLEERLKRPISGLRHHYWALDWRKPYLTYRQHVKAGFDYDLSMAWRDAAGFRAGTSLPFRPWDPEKRKALDIQVVPTAIMDDHVITAGEAITSAVDKTMQMVETIRKVGGVANVDWHTEGAIDDYCYAGHRSVMEMVLRQIVSDESSWVTTPQKLVEHWQNRRKLLQVSNEGCLTDLGRVDS